MLTIFMFTAICKSYLCVNLNSLMFFLYLSEVEIMNLKIDGDHGYILVCDLHFQREIYDSMNDFLLTVEITTVKGIKL